MSGVNEQREVKKKRRQRLELALIGSKAKSCANKHKVIRYFDPSFFKHTKEFEKIFLPPNTPLTLQVIKEQQKFDPVISIVYDWIKKKTKPDTLNPSIKRNSCLHTYYKQFSHL